VLTVLTKRKNLQRAERRTRDGVDHVGLLALLLHAPLGHDPVKLSRDHPVPVNLDAVERDPLGPSAVERRREGELFAQDVVALFAEERKRLWDGRVVLVRRLVDELGQIVQGLDELLEACDKKREKTKPSAHLPLWTIVG
jgi:hypothetical protein